jgi:ketosteroid isomerase-like protein
VDKYENEILNTEKAFTQLAKEKGLKIAFSTYASEEAVLFRENKLIKGKRAIGDYFKKWPWRNVQLAWTPDFVSVAASGDLGYTYGKYTFEGTDESGELKQFSGIFHTVWKREADGEWRYVWD